jgi:hypothetical protein
MQSVYNLTKKIQSISKQPNIEGRIKKKLKKRLLKG